MDISDEISIEIPNSWCWCRLNSVISLLSGRDLLPNKYNNKKIGVPYITGASNIHNETIIVNRWTDSPATISQKGDLLITCKGTIGSICINNLGRLHIARQIMAITPIIIKTSYIQIFIETQIKGLQAKAKSMIPGISRNDILFALFPLPPLSEQERIVKSYIDLSSKIKPITDHET